MVREDGRALVSFASVFAGGRVVWIGLDDASKFKVQDGLDPNARARARTVKTDE